MHLCDGLLICGVFALFKGKPEPFEEIEKFNIRQPPKGEKDVYDSENSWISDWLRRKPRFLRFET